MIYTHVAAVAVGLAIGFSGAWKVQDWRLGSQIAELRQGYEQKLNDAIQAARAEEQRRTAEVQKAADEAFKREEQARADADAARSAGERLRDQLAKARAAIRVNPATPAASEAADATERMLADVQSRLDEATDRIARFADQAHTAGTACQRSYQALTE